MHIDKNPRKNRVGGWNYTKKIVQSYFKYFRLAIAQSSYRAPEPRNPKSAF